MRLTLHRDEVPPHLVQYFRPESGCGECHICVLVDVFRLVRKILRKDGVCFINYGDCYAGAPNGRSAADVKAIGRDDRTFRDKPFSTVTAKGHEGTVSSINLKAKDLVGMPWRLALALQADGWWLRSDIIWSKPNPMPSSVTDRPTTSHEYLFLLAKSERYFMDMDAIREPHSEPCRSTGRLENRGSKDVANGVNGGFGLDGVRPREYNPAGRNRRTVWTIVPQPTPEAHFATFPEALVEPCILAGTSERGVCPDCGAPWERVTEKSGGTIGKGWTSHKDDLRLGAKGGDEGGPNVAAAGYKTYRIEEKGWRPTCAHPHTEEELLPAICLDPFAGSGTVSRVASRLGRRSIGIELSEEYVNKIARKRNSQGGLGL